MRLLKPFAVTAQLGYAIPTKSSVNEEDEETGLLFAAPVPLSGRSRVLICELKLALLLLATLGCSTAAQAHALLERARPAVGSTVASSPGSVTLYFTEKLEPKFSGGDVRGPGGARVDHGTSVSGNVMRLGVGGLRPGRYSVAWHALSVDTHKTQGSFSFQVGK